jgi:hypothetical protein
VGSSSTTVRIDKFATVDAGLVNQLNHARIDLHDAASLITVGGVNQRVGRLLCRCSGITTSSTISDRSFWYFFSSFAKLSSSFRVRRHPILHVRQFGKSLGDHFSVSRTAALTVLPSRQRRRVCNASLIFSSSLAIGCRLHQILLFPRFSPPAWPQAVELSPFLQPAVPMLSQVNPRHAAIRRQFVAPDRDRLERQRAFTSRIIVLP